MPKTRVVAGETLRVVSGRRGAVGEVVVGEEGHRWRDGKILCPKRCLTRVVVDGRRYRQLLRIADADPGEVFYLPTAKIRKRREGEIDKGAAGLYRDGKRISEGRVKAVPALCTQPKMKHRPSCRKHGSKAPEGILNPAARTLRYSKVLGKLAASYDRHREGDPTELSEEIWLSKALLDERIVPRLNEGLTANAVKRLRKIHKRLHKVAGEVNEQKLIGPIAEMGAVLDDAEQEIGAQVEFSRHVEGMAKAVRAQTTRDRQLEAIVRESDLLAYQFRLLVEVRDSFVALLQLCRVSKGTAEWKGAYQVLAQLQETVKTILAPPEVRR